MDARISRIPLQERARNIRRLSLRMVEVQGQRYIGQALRLKGNPALVYNSMSDGELDEGSTWDAALSAAHHGLQGAS